MYKLVVLSVLFAAVAAKPSLYHGAYAALPAAVSHQARVDYISKPVVTAYTAPIVATAPVVSAALPAAVSHQSRVDIINKAAYVETAPVIATANLVHAPAIAYTAPAAVSHQSRVDVINKAVVASPVVVKTSPIIAPAVALPAAVSHQSRVDYINKPAVYAAYTAPLTLGYQELGW